jgi:S-formylglutathione hydrolase FrmB
MDLEEAFETVNEATQSLEESGPTVSSLGGGTTVGVIPTTHPSMYQQCCHSSPSLSRGRTHYIQA